MSANYNNGMSFVFVWVKTNFKTKLYDSRIDNSNNKRRGRYFHRHSDGRTPASGRHHKFQ